MTTLYKTILLACLGIGVLMIGCGAPPPFPLTATDGSQTGKVVVDWTEWAHDTDATTFAVLRSTDPTTSPATWTPIGTSETTSYDDDQGNIGGAVADQVYFYAVATTDATGDQAVIAFDGGHHGASPGSFTGDADAWSCVTKAMAEYFQATYDVAPGTFQIPGDINPGPTNMMDIVISSLGGGILQIDTTSTTFEHTLTSPYMVNGQSMFIMAVPAMDGWSRGVSAYIDNGGAGPNSGMSVSAYTVEDSNPVAPVYVYATSCIPGVTPCWTDTSYVQVDPDSCGP